MVVLSCILLALFLFFCFGFLSQGSARRSTTNLLPSASNRGRAKQQAVRKYIKYVGPNLRDRYGIQRHYSPTQVKQTISAGGYGSDFDCYALAMFCAQDDFGEYHRTTGESCDYDMMRSEVTNAFGSTLPSDGTFDACDMIDFSDRIDTFVDTPESFSMWSGSGENSSSSSGSNDYSSGSDYSGSDNSSSSSGSDYSGGSD
jgi:hypothetical protein